MTKRKLPLLRNCRICGNEFISRYNSVYCSEECRKVGRKLKNQHLEICSVCGNSFYTTSYNNPVCPVCQAKEGFIKNTDDGFEPKPCLYCGTLYVPKSKKSKFCSPKCRGLQKKKEAEEAEEKKHSLDKKIKEAKEINVSYGILSAAKACYIDLDKYIDERRRIYD